MDDCIIRTHLKKAIGSERASIVALGKSDYTESSYVLYDDKPEPLSVVTISFGAYNIDPARAKDTYSKVICIPFAATNSKNSHLRPVVLSVSKDYTVGWLVPVLHFKQLYEHGDEIWDREEEVESTEQPYGIDFVEAGLIGLLKDSKCIAFSEFTGKQGLGTYTIGDYYQDCVAVLVLNREQLASVSPDILRDDMISESTLEEINVQMICHGYSPRRDIAPSSFLTLFDWNDGGKIHLKRVSSDLGSFLGEIGDLVYEAAMSTSAPVAFFLLYQVIEAISFVVFQVVSATTTERLRNLMSDLGQASNPHDYSDLIRKTQSVVSYMQAMNDTSPRLALLPHFCSRKEPRLLNDLDRLSRSLHEAIERHIRGNQTYTVPRNKDFLASTIAVRHHVVHTQSKWRNEKRLKESLWEVNRALLRVILDVLCKFDKTEGTNLMQQSESG